MTVSEGEAKDAVRSRATSIGSSPNASSPVRPRVTAAHVLPAIVPAEWPAFVRYGVAVGASLLALGVTLPIASALERVILVLFWPAVIGAAWFGGVGPGIVASVLSIALANYFLVGTPGELTFAPADLLPLGVFLFASTSVALLTDATRTARRTAARAAARNAELAHELEMQAIELEQQLDESQSLSEELEVSSEELAERSVAAEKAEAFSRGIIESIADPFVVHDADWRFRYINEAAAAVFRQSPRASLESPIGRLLWEVYPDIAGTVFERQMRRAAAEQRPVTFEAFSPARGEWYRLSCYPLADGGVATQWTDITARKRSEETEHFVARASEILGSSLDYEATLEKLAQVVVPHLADWCAVHILSEDGTRRQLAVAHVDPAKVAHARDVHERYPPRLDAPTGVPNVIRTGDPELYEQITDEMLVAGAQDQEHLRLTRALGLGSAMVIPLLGREGVLGALTLISAESGRRYTRADLPLPTELARRAAFAVENAQLHREALRARMGAERSARIADRLYALTVRLSAAATPSQVAEAVLAEARATFGAECGRMSLLQEDGDTAQLLAQFGYPDDPQWRTYALRSVGPPRVAVETARGVFLESNADARERFPTEAAALAGAGIETAVILPIADGRVIALISLSWLTLHPLPSDEREFMERFASQCGQALRRAIATEAEHRARELAEEANRAKTQFLATMSHELRTPLNAISGYAELLSLGLRGPTTPEQQEDLARIMRSQRHLLSVINDILNFARLEAGHVEYHMTNVPLSTLLGDLESLIRPQLAAKRLEFICDAVPNGTLVQADTEKVRQVLLNLLANAVKFTTPGGRIRVSSDYDDARVHIHVADTGIGIPADRRAAIFEPFVQLHRTLAQPAEGTGLGLAISRDLARGMRGELSVDSKPGAGSTFTLTLQRAETQG